MTLEERFSRALHNTARAWRLALDRRLKDLGVGQAGWMTIATVAKATEPLSQSELANRLGVENPTVVSMVDRLVKAGLLLREPSTSDRRIKYLVLTDAGQQLYQRVRAEADAFRIELLHDIDPTLLATMTNVLETLQSRAEQA
ncbi:MarR family winged helix-turn-helix transcriptional regulator [Vogesella sp. LIG4]|uniref:MarR family winged helix-turn-helix transcriptional regulator n=1 Tax=Vogesella sp. LIG4 TaxID=1192162 RepID=UPI000B5AEAD7|nr:MarR family transcriptional regulator [Vogesella sp. LIG4]